MPGSTATPNVLTDPGYLFYAPLGTTVPTMTVSGSKFTDAWPAAWLSVGATDDGSEFDYETKVDSVEVAEFFDPIKWVTTSRSGSLAFAMADWTLTKLKLALNGGTVTVMSGTGATQLNKFTPPAPGSEVRSMLGWESLDNTVRIVIYQALQGGTMKTQFKKGNKNATIACTFKFEIPTSPTTPFDIWTAGTSRA